MCIQCVPDSTRIPGDEIESTLSNFTEWLAEFGKGLEP